MASGLAWKRNENETLDRRRRFFRGEMQDSILAVLPVALDLAREWQGFETGWGCMEYAQEREFASNEEIFARQVIGLQQRAQVEDDSLPVLYSMLDVGEGMVGAMFGQPIRFFHRPRSATYSATTPLLVEGYSQLAELKFSLASPWARRLLSIQEYFEQHSEGRFAQHNCLTMDALNFVVEMRGATAAYLDLHDCPAELHQLMEIGLDFNLRFQQAQFERIPGYGDGCFVWLGGWAPFSRAVSLSVDAYVMCSVNDYVEHGFDYQRRLIEHFGHGLMHFHCNRPDLAAEVARLPGLELFQYGAGLPNGPEDHTFLPQIHQAADGIPIQVGYPLGDFRRGLVEGTLLPNVMYMVHGEPLSIDEANRLTAEVRAYRA